MTANTELLVLAVVLGGLFGWLLGRLPDRWVHLIAAVVVAFTLVVIARSLNVT